jgi:hypothetical protein
VADLGGDTGAGEEFPRRFFVLTLQGGCVIEHLTGGTQSIRPEVVVVAPGQWC